MGATYKCAKCRHKIHSKCRHQRSTFAQDEDPINYYSVLTNILKYKDVLSPKAPDTIPFISLKLLCPEGDSPDEHLKHIFHLIRGMTDREVELYCCTHNFKIMPGEECDFGCCVGEDVTI